MKSDKTKYTDWTLIDWDGNTSLGYKCYRKSFSKGHVSIGVGNFDLIVFSYGASSDDSCTATRWRKTQPLNPIDEQTAMSIVDKSGGYHNKIYRELYMKEDI